MGIRKGRVPFTCVQCSTSFEVYPSAAKRGEGVFCSIKCVNEHRAENRQPLGQRFWKKVNKTDGCWLWTASAIKGYGQISVDHKGTNDYTHRVSWILHFGEIPEGLSVLHKCDTPLCVRPDHLFLGKERENQRDRAVKGRGNARLITAFGETKPVCSWLEDSRCVISRNGLSRRLQIGLPPELAITLPVLNRKQRKKGPHQYLVANMQSAEKQGETPAG